MLRNTSKKQTAYYRKTGRKMICLRLERKATGQDQPSNMIVKATNIQTVNIHI